MLDRSHALRLCRALIFEEMTRVLPGTAREVPPQTWTETTRIDETGLGFDSLARIDLVTVFNRRFGLHVSGVEDYMLIRLELGDWAELLQEHFRRIGPDTEMVFFTSGSTGQPKETRHPLGRLVEEIDAHIATSLADRPERLVSLVPPHHIYGFLFTVLLPSRLGCDLCDLAGKGPGASGRERRAGDLIIGTPHLLSRALPLWSPGPAGVNAVTSTAPAPAELWDQARSAGLASLIEVFGSSETAGVGIRDGADRPFRLLPYLSPGNPPTRNGAPIALQDRLDWIGATQFRVLGRQDGAVQVGGNNVFPDEIARSLCAQSGVKAAHVRLGGERLKAFIVPADAARTERLEIALRQAMAAAHPPAACPASYTFGPDLPRNPMGKLVDWTVVPQVQPEDQAEA